LGGQAKSPGTESGSASPVHWHYHWTSYAPPPPPCCHRPCGAVAPCLPGASSGRGSVRFGGEFKDLGT
jgi:hypothetical protein